LKKINGNLTISKPLNQNNHILDSLQPNLCTHVKFHNVKILLIYGLKSSTISHMYVKQMKWMVTLFSKGS